MFSLEPCQPEDGSLHIVETCCS